MSVTIKEIAKRSGLSVPTVSRILNSDSEQFRPATREKVLRAARELGYRPNSYRMALRTKRFNAIGLLVGPRRVDCAATGSMMRTLLAELHDRNQHLVVGQVAGGAEQSESLAPKMLREWSVDGMLMDCDETLPGIVEQLIDDNKIPAIWLNCRRANDCIYPDDESGAREATERLLKIGHRRIAFVSLDGEHSQRERQAGYESAMKDAAMPRQAIAPKETVPQADRLDHLSDWLGKHREQAPTAVVCAGRSESLALFTAAMGAGMSVPQDLSIFGMHDEPMDDPGRRITAMCVPASEIATQGLAALNERIAEPARAFEPRALPLAYCEGTTLAPPGGV